MDSDKIFITKFDTTAQYNAAKDSLAKPHVSLTKDDGTVHYDKEVFVEEYLTFVAKQSGTFTFMPQNNNVINYSTDNGTTWVEGNSVNVNNGDRVLWKGTMTSSYQGIGAFSSTASFDVQGNAMSLLFGDNFNGQTDLTGKNFAFYELFRENTNVVNTRNLILPATTLAKGCYDGMFWGCTNLTIAPELPATTLAEGCYGGMFWGCTNLTIAPELPATTLPEGEELGCYASMFRGCTSLTTAPELPATTLTEDCYVFMFSGCTSLNYIKAMFTTTPDSWGPTRGWVSSVAATGTFVKNSAATWNVVDIYGVPSGWTIETA